MSFRSDAGFSDSPPAASGTFALETAPHRKDGPGPLKTTVAKVKKSSASLFLGNDGDDNEKAIGLRLPNIFQTMNSFGGDLSCQ